MPLSQFTIYSSSDIGSPKLTGTSGSLISVLDAVLINGYGNKSAAGWTKPIPNDSASCYACYRQPSGSGFTLFINDGGITGSAVSGVKDAWATGYEYLLGFTGSYLPSTGYGYGQFPLATQTFPTTTNGGIASGSLFWRKSNTVDLTPRPWIIFADAYTFHMFVQTGDTANIYYYYSFGDIFSFKPTPDNYKCYIRGRCAAADNGSGGRFDNSDNITRPNSTTMIYNDFMARTSGGGGQSISVVKLGDLGKTSILTLVAPGGAGETGYQMLGSIPFFNPTDSSIYVSPITLAENPAGILRGRIRGLYHPCHAAGNFTDGQIIGGVGEFAGKTFQVVKGGATGSPGGIWMIEISPTVETNPS